MPRQQRHYSLILVAMAHKPPLLLESATVYRALVSEDSQNPPTLHPLPTCPQAGHDQRELGLVLLLRHVVEGAAQVLLSLGQLVGAHLQPGALGDHLRDVVALGDPDVAVGRVGVGLAFEEDQLSGVDGEHLPGPQALDRVHLQVVGAVCRSKGGTEKLHIQEKTFDLLPPDNKLVSFFFMM